MKNSKKSIIITGGCGFIGSHVVRHFVKTYPEYDIHVVDALTYAGNLWNLNDIASCKNLTFHHCDIRNLEKMVSIMKTHKIDSVIHLAAESHVDRSIENPMDFITTNVIGTCNLLEAARVVWDGDYDGKKFYHISTDEVYGALPMDGSKFHEDTKYDPHSPYSASKASSDHFVRAYHDTYGLPVNISNCSNNYGPYQFPEKLIPLVISRLVAKENIPVYGTGKNVRDWLYTEDHVKAIDTIFHNGKDGETYNIGGNNEQSNIDVVHAIIDAYCEITGVDVDECKELITYVIDRKGHDLRYAIDATKIRTELGWEPEYTDFSRSLKETVKWYLENKHWCETVKNGTYRGRKLL